MSKQFKPMLAVKASISDIKKGMMVSPKIDGVRVTNVNGVLRTRNGKPIANRYIQQLLSVPELAGFDGEITIGEPNAHDVCRKTVSALSSIDGEPDFTWHIFDDVTNPQDGFSTRYMNARLRIAALNYHYVVVIMMFPVLAMYTPAVLEQQFLKEGYEGIVARALHGQYKYGRSTLKEGGMLKVKRFDDGEAVIIKCVELRHQDGSNSNTLGAFVCLDTDTNCQFNIGTGFDNEQRISFWQQKDQLIGQLVNYRFFSSGQKDAPRFPVFHAIRSDISPPDDAKLN